MGPQRQFYRIAVERRGVVRRGDQTAECDVLDLTEKGVQLRTGLPVTPGDRLQLDVSLTDAVTIRCGVQVTRASGTSVGVCIVEIAPDDQEQLSRFIEDVIALNLGGF